MLVTAQMLRDLGAKNVIALSTPAYLINGGVATAKTLKYNSLDEVKLAEWFKDAPAGALLIIFEGDSNDHGYTDSYVVRIFDFSRWNGSSLNDEDQFSPLSVHRKLKLGS